MAERRRAVIWSPESLADLDEIWNYYLQIAGRNTADKIVREIGEAIHLLEDHPSGGRSRNEVRPGLRSVVARPHIVFYRVKDAAAEIVRVLDGRQDIHEIFSERR
jgi:plasmid stabilization system protein ParE